MISILIIEDNLDKLRNISREITSIPSITVENITHASTLIDARNLLRTHTYDLLILDIMIPNRIDQMPLKDGGLHLLQELNDRPEIFNMPSHIIAITEHDDIFPKFQQKLSQEKIIFVKYYATTTDWIAEIQTPIKRLISSQTAQSRKIRDYESLLCILCALESPELTSVLKNGWKWEPCQMPGDDTQYFHSKIKVNDIEHMVYAAAAPRMGMPSSAILASKMIFHFRPKYLCMCGIAAGISQKGNFGDILLPDPCWDWGSGKWTSRDLATCFEIDPHQLSVDPSLRGKIERLCADSALMASIRSGFQSEPPDFVLKLRRGPVASGASVLANMPSVDHVKEQHRKLIGIDMETYAVYLAAQECPNPRPLAFALKSIVDFADSKKDDRFHPYAAYTSAALVRHIAEKVLI